MLPALRVLWAAAVGVYDEAFTFVRGSLVWVALNLPLLLVVLVTLLSLPAPLVAGAAQASALPLLAAFGLMLLLPTPASVGLGELARIAAAGDAPGLSAGWSAIRRLWRPAAGLAAASALGWLALLVNLVFYLGMPGQWLRLLGLLWLYAIVLWMGMHLYLVPLLLHLPSPRLLDVYRRAALLTLAGPLFSATLALCLALFGLLSVLALPVYLLVAPAYVAQAQALAFRTVRRRLGDLPEDEPA